MSSIQFRVRRAALGPAALALAALAACAPATDSPTAATTSPDHRLHDVVVGGLVDVVSSAEHGAADRHLGGDVDHDVAR